MTNAITIEELMAMDKKQVAEVFLNGHAIPPGSLDNTQYQGIDLTMPKIFHKLMWQTFRKTFYRDPVSGVLRGWNQRMEQTGVGAPYVPKLKKGQPMTFGHYHVLPAEGVTFPRKWQGADYLDYGVAGNTYFDFGKLGFCPLVAVNEGSADLLLGWEVFKIGNTFLPLNDYWALKLEGPLEDIVPVPT